MTFQNSLGLVALVNRSQQRGFKILGKIVAGIARRIEKRPRAAQDGHDDTRAAACHNPRTHNATLSVGVIPGIRP